MAGVRRSSNSLVSVKSEPFILRSVVWRKKKSHLSRAFLFHKKRRLKNVQSTLRVKNHKTRFSSFLSETGHPRYLENVLRILGFPTIKDDMSRIQFLEFLFWKKRSPNKNESMIASQCVFSRRFMK